MAKNIFKSTIISLIVSALSSFCLNGQSIANYSISRNTGLSYASINVAGNAFNSWRNTTSFTQDDNRSDFTNIGFDFWYNGIRYTKFSVSTNGFLDFSSSAADGGPTIGAFGYSNSAFTTSSGSTNPSIAPFYDDLTAQGGVSALGNSIKYNLIGSAPNRILTIEWINMAVYGNTTPSLNFQVKLLETSGQIFINYGTMNTGTQIFSYSMGLNTEILGNPPTVAQLKELQTVNFNLFSNAIQNNLSIMPTTNSQYIFTPIVPTPVAGSLAFTAIGQTSMTLNWTNWASNEVGYVIYNSIDNINFTFVSQTAINAVSATIPSLLPGTTYYWKVYAVTEGCLSSPVLGTQATAAAGNKISITTGLWNNANIWSPIGVPSNADNVTIANGHIVTINTNAVCNDLFVGQGLTGVLSIGDNATARDINIYGNVLINSGATFNVNTSSNITHNLTLPGNVINNGTLNFATDANSLCNTSFTKNGNQIVSGSGVTTTFNKITLNMGSTLDNILDIQTSNFVAPNDFITLNSGTFKLSTSGASNITPFSVAGIIPQNGAIWVNSAPSTVNTLATLSLYGNITVSNGVLNIGNAADEDLLSNGGFLTISGGTLNIAGKYYATGINNLTKFTISGGSVIVPSFGSTDITIAPFQIAGAGSQFNMSGGNLILPREGGTGSQNLGFVNIGTSGGSVTGGTLQIGSSTTPLTQIIQINSTFPIGNLLVNSVNVNASLLTNSLSVINDVTINSGTLTANSISMALGKNWINNGGQFVSGTGTVGFLGTTSQSIFKSTGEIFNNIEFSNAGVKTMLSAFTASNVLINTGSNLDVNTTNNLVTIRQNFTNNGLFNARSGNVLLNGTVAQNIGGTSITGFYDLTLNNNSGASILSNSVSLIGTLNLNNGTFNTNGKVFTMISNITGTARIAQITGTGNITGNVTVQRFSPGGTTGWTLIGAPISTPLTYSDWDDNLYISCSSCPDGSAAGFISIYTYDETAVGTYSSASSYVAMAGISDPIQSTKGYWFYFGSGWGTSTDLVFDVTGNVNKLNVPINLSLTNTGFPMDDGWNLISNPYPSAISWAALKGTTTNLDDAIYAYNPDLNAGTGAHATYINGISSPAIISGGIGDVIPMGQGFYVHSTGATVISAKESNKIAGNPTFLRTAAASSVTTKQMLRLQMDGPTSFLDETVLYMQGGATDFFDAGFDAIKLAGQDASAPTIALEKGGSSFQVNGIAPISGNFSMPLKTVTGYAGTYTISLQNIGAFPTGACVNLYDKYTGTTTNLKVSNYIFSLSDTTTVARFDLNITLDALNANTNINQTSCLLLNSGEIISKGISSGPWNYIWKNNSGAILKTSLNKTTADTLSGLGGGSYNLEINTVGMCDNGSFDYNINLISTPVASFTSVDSVDLNSSSSVNFINNSINSNVNDWFFGDGIGYSNLISPNYIYNLVGTYQVKLITTSLSGCSDTSLKNIVVYNSSLVGIEQFVNGMSNVIIKNIEKNNYELVQSFKEIKTISYGLFDTNGKLILSRNNYESQNLKINVNLNSYSAGIYYLKLVIGDKPLTVKLVTQ